MLKFIVGVQRFNNIILFSLIIAITTLYSVKDYNFILIKDFVLILGALIFSIFLFFKNYIKIKKIIIYPLIFILWIAFSVALSKFKYVGIPVVLISITCFILFFLIIHLDFNVNRVSDIIVLSFVPSLIIGLLQIFIPDKMKIFLVFGNRIPSTFGNPNFFGAYIAAITPFIINRFFNSKNLYYKFFLVLLFFTSILLLIFTGSKASLLAFIAGIFVFILLYFRHKIIKNKSIILSIVLFFIIAITIFTLIALKSTDDSFFFRKQVWSGTFKLILNNMFTGTGAGSFFIVFPQYRPYELMKWTYEHSYEVLFPENIFLQIGAETGLPGILLFIYLIYIIYKNGILSPPEYLAGLTALLTTNFFGVDINYAPSMFLFVLIIGMVLKNNDGYISINPFYLKIISFTFLIFLIYVCTFWLNKHISGIYTKNGVFFSKIGDFKIAIENYKKALKYYDKNLEALYFLGSSYYDSGDFESALKTFKNIERYAPDFVLLHYKIAKIYNERGLYEEAIDEYKKMLKIDPYLKEALVELAYIYYNKKTNFDEAEKYLLKALEKYSNDSRLYSNLGNIYFMSGEIEKSIESFKKAIEIKQDKDYYYNLGAVYFSIKDIKNAKFYLKKAEEIDPSDSKIKQMLRMLYRYETKR
ncbi:MAG: tetratricopeptide repeat protein [Candidatus Goldbacteria bacterium]|nr:tetratricopeptide repeat protein [Candidatus Goldiibacteriota bacterium]